MRVELVASPETVRDGAALLRAFNLEYDEPSPPTDVLASRLSRQVDGAATLALVAYDGLGQAAGVAVLRLGPSLWTEGLEAYLAELYVVPGLRGQGYGRALITTVLAQARGRGADYAFLVTSEEDEAAQRLYAAAGFRRTEGEGGPTMLAFEREL